MTTEQTTAIQTAAEKIAQAISLLDDARFALAGAYGPKNEKSVGEAIRHAAHAQGEAYAAGEALKS